MKLIELDASFVGEADPRDGSHRMLPSVQGAQGLKVQCPKCAIGKEFFREAGTRGVIGAHYILIWLKTPRNAPTVPEVFNPRPRWEFFGDTIDTLSLHPSVDLTHPDGCHWHGFLEGGKTRDAG